MPDPTGISEQRLRRASMLLRHDVRACLKAAAQAADEAHAPELHRRIMAALAAVDDAIEEADK